MQSLKNITIGRRIFIGLGLIVIILIVQGVTNITQLATVSGHVSSIESDHLPSAITLGRINTNIADMSADQLRLNTATDPQEQTDLEDTLEAIHLAIQKDQATYEKFNSTQQELQLYTTFKAQLAKFIDLHEQITILAKAHKTQEANKLLADMDVIFDQISESLGKLIAQNGQDATAASDATDRSFALSRKLTYIGVLFALLLAFVVGFWMNRGAAQVAGVVKNSVDQLIKLSLALSASTQQASAGAQQNAAIAQQVAAGATQQSRQAEEISRALAQMSQAIRQMAATSQGVSANTTQASKLAQQTGESTEKISKMADVVTTTAEQTNLLALNAAIEAARAGEAGRGFAVVADEVRKLADSSSKAAGEVQLVIKEISNSISVTVESIGNSSLKIGEVAGGINQQAAAINQISSTMSSIAAVAQQSASGAQQLSASTQQTSAATQQVAAASNDLLRLADSLQKLVRKAEHSASEDARQTHAGNASVGGSQPVLHRPSAYHAVENSEPERRVKPTTHIDIMKPKSDNLSNSASAPLSTATDEETKELSTNDESH